MIFLVSCPGTAGGYHALRLLAMNPKTPFLTEELSIASMNTNSSRSYHSTPLSAANSDHSGEGQSSGAIFGS